MSKITTFTGRRQSGQTTKAITAALESVCNKIDAGKINQPTVLSIQVRTPAMVEPISALANGLLGNLHRMGLDRDRLIRISVSGYVETDATTIVLDDLPIKNIPDFITRSIDSSIDYFITYSSDDNLAGKVETFSLDVVTLSSFIFSACVELQKSMGVDIAAVLTGGGTLELARYCRDGAKWLLGSNHPAFGKHPDSIICYQLIDRLLVRVLEKYLHQPNPTSIGTTSDMMPFQLFLDAMDSLSIADIPFTEVAQKISTEFGPKRVVLFNREAAERYMNYSQWMQYSDAALYRYINLTSTPRYVEMPPIPADNSVQRWTTVDMAFVVARISNVSLLSTSVSGFEALTADVDFIDSTTEANFLRGELEFVPRLLRTPFGWDIIGFDLRLRNTVDQ